MELSLLYEPPSKGKIIKKNFFQAFQHSELRQPGAVERDGPVPDGGGLCEVRVRGLPQPLLPLQPRPQLQRGQDVHPRLPLPHTGQEHPQHQGRGEDGDGDTRHLSSLFHTRGELGPTMPLPMCVLYID